MGENLTMGENPTMGDPRMGDPTMGENPTMGDTRRWARTRRWATREWASLRWEMRLKRANTSRSANASSISCIATTTSERQTRRARIVIDGHTRRSRRSSRAKSGRSAPKRTIASAQTETSPMEACNGQDEHRPGTNPDCSIHEA